MTKTIGELALENKEPLLKMWSVDVSSGNRQYIKHSHSRFEITVVNRGAGEYTTENKVYPIEEGDVFVFSSNEIHCITNVGNSGLSITNLHFEPRYLANSEKFESNNMFMYLCFSHSPDFENRIPKEKSDIIRTNHNNIRKEFLKSDELLPRAVHSYLSLILIDLIRNQNYTENSIYDKKSRIFNILSVYDYIDEHLSEEITLEELAKTVLLSPNYFSHMFKKLNGITLWDYINGKRIEKASRILVSENNGMTMLEIATKCGFNNTANFNKIFKKYKGFTPSELKNNPKLLWH